jgi:hypothetical protein
MFEQDITGLLPGAPVPYSPPIGWQRLRADNYRLGRSTWDQAFWRDIKPHFKSPVQVKVKSIAGMIEDITFNSPQEAWPHFHYPFVGKGSPEQAQIAIQLIYHFRKVSTSLQQFVARDFIGLDCNGFVGGYFQRCVQGWNWQKQPVSKDPGPTTLISGLVDGQGRANQMPDLRSLSGADTYIFGWCYDNGQIRDPSKDHPTDYGHVMITEPGTLRPNADGTFAIDVVEATASGDRKLRYITYTLKSANRQAFGSVFRVQRGPAGEEMAVRVARLQS